MVLWGSSPPFSQPAGFLNQVTIPGPKPHLSIYWLSFGEWYTLGLGYTSGPIKIKIALVDVQEACFQLE